MTNQQANRFGLPGPRCPVQGPRAEYRGFLQVGAGINQYRRHPPGTKRCGCNQRTFSSQVSVYHRSKLEE